MLQPNAAFLALAGIEIVLSLAEPEDRRRGPARVGWRLALIRATVLRAMCFDWMCEWCNSPCANCRAWPATVSSIIGSPSELCLRAAAGRLAKMVPEAMGQVRFWRFSLSRHLWRGGLCAGLMIRVWLVGAYPGRSMG